MPLKKRTKKSSAPIFISAITEDDEERFLKQLDAMDGTAGNTALRRKLHWDNVTYWRVRSRLLDKGVLTLGRGKGGSVRRASLPLAPATVAADKEQRVENALYEPVKAVLRDSWVKDKNYRFDDLWIEIMAHQGRRETGGKWSRPDLALIGVTNYPYLPGRYLDVMTFEVKIADALDVSAVYEALAHRRGATRSYVLVEVPPNKKEAMDPILAVVRDEAARHGIGVIEIGQASDYETWNETVEAERVEADPQKINEFITVQFPTAIKDELNKRAKS